MPAAKPWRPDVPTVCRLEVVAMPNGEIICLGKTIGWLETLGQYITPAAP